MIFDRLKTKKEAKSQYGFDSFMTDTSLFISILEITKKIKTTDRAIFSKVFNFFFNLSFFL